MAVCIGNWINKRNYPYALNFIYSFSHVVAWAVECLCSICEFYLFVSVICLL